MDAQSAFSVGNPCEVFTPTNFEKLSLRKKIQVSEVIRECERKLSQKQKDSSTKRGDIAAKRHENIGIYHAPLNRPAY